MARRSWDDIKQERLRSAAARAGYERARRVFEVGERVRELREAAALTQRELAEKIGSTQPAIARLEAGGVTPSLDTLERIAGALGVELVVQFSGPPKRPSAGRRARADRRSA